MSDRILVPFEGEGSGVDELTWGQQHIWLAMVATGSSLAMTAIRPLEPSATVEEFVEELRFYLSRFQVMRTRYRTGPDGRTLQVVSASGVAELDIVDADRGEDPAQVAEALSVRYYDTPFDYERDWPVRMGLVRQAGALTHMVMAISHHAGDTATGMVMFFDMLDRDPVTGAAKAPVAAPPPLELVRLQREPTAQRQSEAALRHWAGVLRQVPTRRLPGPTDHGGHRHWRPAWESPATHLALRVIAERTRADPTAILLAVHAVALARTTGNHPVVVTMLVNNRFRPGFADMAGPMIQSGLCVLDVAGITIDDAIAHARRRALTTYKYAYYDKLRMVDLIARIGQERGDEIDLGCLFNDRRRQPPREGVGPVPTEAEVLAARALTTLRWDTKLEAFNEKLMMNFGDTPTVGLSVEVTVDTFYLAPPRLEAYLAELEAVAIEAAFNPDARTLVEAPVAAPVEPE